MNKNSFMWGVLFVLAGITLIVNKMGYLPELNVFNVVITVILVGAMIKNLFNLNFAGILFPIALICIIYDQELGLTAITPWTVLFAALLGSVGLSMIFNRKPKWRKKQKWHNWDSSDFEIIDEENEGRIIFHTMFGGGTKYINTDKFEQADLRCKFGGMEVYFDKSDLHTGKGVIRLDVAFSGVELYIPKDWTVENRINVFLGDIEEVNKTQGDPNKKVTLIGNVSFSGVEIKYI